MLVDMSRDKCLPRFEYHMFYVVYPFVTYWLNLLRTSQQFQLSRWCMADCVYSRQCTAEISCDWMIIEYIHDEYFNMHLTMGTCNGRAGTTAREYVLHYPGRRHPDANVFRRLEHSLHETGSVTSMAHVNAGRPRTCQRRSITGAVERSVEKLTRYHTRIWTIPTANPKHFMTVNCIHATTRGVHNCFPTIIL
jgi:hypothetical protein